MHGRRCERQRADAVQQCARATCAQAQRHMCAGMHASAHARARTHTRAPRTCPPQVGSIRLGGRSAADFSRGEWARAVAMVSQEPVLFSGSIADNIAYGRFGRCSMRDIVAAAEAANAHEFIRELPDGYHTLVGDRGALLSGEPLVCA